MSTLIHTVCLVLVASGASATGAPDVTMVDLQHASVADKLAVLSCAGILNRPAPLAAGGQRVYTVMGSDDLKWWNTTMRPPTAAIEPSVFLKACAQSQWVQGRWISYNSSSQQLVIPVLVTLVGVLDAIPLEPAAAASLGAGTKVFDAIAKWTPPDALAATDYVYATYANQTTGMSKMDPGLDVHHHPIHPNITGEPNTGLTDYIVKEKLFNFFLNDGCIPGTKDHALTLHIMDTNPWPRPVAVYGYDDTFGVIGDPFEAETTCAMHNGKSLGMGQIASDGCNNLAFWSETPITTPIAQTPTPPPSPYSTDRTYVSLVIGDGDNVNYNKGGHYAWMEDRVNRCSATGNRSKTCFPLLWSISPHLLRLAPEWLQWYAKQCRATGQDWLVLPPSGDLYAYPSLFTPSDQVNFVANTERDCELLSTSATVAWEWFGTWAGAIKNYFPRYGVRGVVRSIFATNVPYPIPVLEFAPGEFYKTFNKSTVLFRPREWRGTANATIPFRNAVCSPAQLAHEISTTYPRGSVGHVYLTSDGGASLESLYEMVALLEDHVSVVDHETLADMALERDALLESQGSV